MKSIGITSTVIGLVFFLCLFSDLAMNAQATDINAMLKQVNKELRQAQKDMFAGKTDKSIATLENIQSLIVDLKTADENNASVKSAENKYRKLVKDLERRTGKDLGGGTLTVAESSSKTVLPDKPIPKTAPEKTEGTSPVDMEKKAENVEIDAAATSMDAGAKKPGSPSAKVPYAARKPMSNATRLLNSLERSLNDLADPNYGGNKDQLVKRIEAKLVEIKTSLQEAKNLAAQKGISSHPDFDQAETQVASAEKKVDLARGGYEKDKAQADATSKEVDTDVMALKAVYDSVRPVFDAAMGTVIYYNDLKPVEKLIVQIENFEKNSLTDVTTQTKAFADKYGTTKGEIDKKAATMGYTGQYRASFPYVALSEGVENIKKTRTVMAEDLVKTSNKRLAGIGEGHDFHVVRLYGEVKGWLNMANRYSSDNPKVKEAQANIDQQIAKGMKAFNAKIDSRKWPDHASNAPSNAKKLADVALDWFKKDTGWGKRDKNPQAKDKEPRKPLSVVITGPWSIQKKNILGEPIMYGLPILLAVKLDSDKELNVVRVFSLTMRTIEKRGVKMEPPFDHVTVGNNYFIRPSEIK